MDIVISERQLSLLEAYVMPSGFKDRVEKVEDEKMDLENYIEAHGEYMTDITNGKVYLVQYLKALSELVGREYAVCAPVRSDGTYGAFYVKPWETFKKSEASAAGVRTKPEKLRQNLYQQTGLNR